MSVQPAPSAPAAQGGDALPAHVAIIMDGNGRWAKARGLPRSVGHERGVEALRRTVEAGESLGLTNLTVFSFSTENWRRPVDEVNALFGLLRLYVRRDLAKLNKRGVRVRIIGRRDGLPQDILDLMEQAETTTRFNSTFNLTIAFNYGARDEIARTARRLAEEVRDGALRPEDITPERFGEALPTSDLPAVDLLIRTSGEYRISNFLLWELAYAELVFLPVLWPDFGEDDLRRAVDEFMGRERRFGAVAPA